MDRSPLFQLAAAITRIHAAQYMRPSPSALQADADTADRVVGLIEKAHDLTSEALAHLEEAAKLSPVSALDCMAAAEELRIILHDQIRGDALCTAREEAERAHIAVEDSYPNSDIGLRSAAE
jgi:hypothetical protein